MAINDVLKDMYKKNTGKELTEEAHNVEDTLKAINRDIPLGGGGSDSNVYIFDMQFSGQDGGYVASKTFGELYQAHKDGKLVVGTDGKDRVLYLTTLTSYGNYSLIGTSGASMYQATGAADDTPIFKDFASFGNTRVVRIDTYTKDGSVIYTGNFSLGDAYAFISNGGVMLAAVISEAAPDEYGTYMSCSAYSHEENGNTTYTIMFASFAYLERTFSSSGAYDDMFDTSRQ